MNFRDLTADEIECRVKKVKDTGAIALLYKTARADYNLLDEAVGAEKWQCSYREIKGNMYCSIQVWSDELKQWISKENCGVESREDGDGNEKKGEASDALKRAGFAWGIGRKLYTAPFIWIPADKITIKESGQRRGIFVTYDKLCVQNIKYDDKQITSFDIYNETKKAIAYSWDINNKAAPRPEPDKPTDICFICNKKVPATFSMKQKKELSGAEIVAACNGMCPECYKANVQ